MYHFARSVRVPKPSKFLSRLRPALFPGIVEELPPSAILKNKRHD